MQTEDDEEKAKLVSDSRTVNLAGGVPADKIAGFAKNSIKTAKYNLITFLPIFLFEMFSRAAYLYFLAQVCSLLYAKHWRCPSVHPMLSIAASSVASCHMPPHMQVSPVPTFLFLKLLAVQQYSGPVACVRGQPAVCHAGLPVMVECCLPFLRVWVHSSSGVCSDCGCYKGCF